MIWQTVCTDSEKTVRLGELFGLQLKGGEVFDLTADLGGGKTTFTKGLASGLGVTQKITSPTFTLSREYAGLNNLTLVHYEFYRLDYAGVIARELSEYI